MPKYIYSTLSCDNKYVRYVPVTPANKDLQKELPLIHTGPDGREHHVLIKGGANVARKDGAMDTPAGVRTKVSDEDWEWLQKDPHFLQHQKNGFIKVTDAVTNPDKVSKDMVNKDKSAPKTPDDPEYQPGYEGLDGAAVAETSKGNKGSNNKGK
jgi:hypothetical protein